jgi:hypothetical protein
VTGKLPPGTPGTLTAHLTRRGRDALRHGKRLHARLQGTLNHRRVDKGLTLVAKAG